MDTDATPKRRIALTGPTAGRWLLLGLVLLAFAHVMWQLDGKPIWWDESLSLQRAESGLIPLLRGVIEFTDGFATTASIDQHPFFYFLVTGLFVRLAGNSEFVLRLVSAMAATLLAPTVWALARQFHKRGIVPAGAGYWAALLVAINPFLLWFGQEARPYALWALLALLSTLLLVMIVAPRPHRGWWVAAFVLVELMFLATHFFAVLLLPVQVAVFFLWLVRRRPLLAVLTAAASLLVGAGIAAAGAWILTSQGGGGNFARISLQILAPDLLNAMTEGLSVDITDVWLIDLLAGGLALVGGAWCLRSRRTLSAGGWLPVAFILAPVLLLWLLNMVRPLYMTARHMSMLVGGFMLLVGIGLAVIGRWQKWAAAVLALVLVAAAGYSTYNYFALETYAKDDYRRLGSYMEGRIMPGDAVLYYTPAAGRILDYYLPVAPVKQAIAAGAPIGLYGVPLLAGTWDDTFAKLTELGRKYDRIWLIKSGPHLVADLSGKVPKWMDKNWLHVRDAMFFSQSSLHAHLYLPKIPVFEALPESVQHPVTAEFGSLIRLAGYDMDPPVAADLPQQARLYWQVLTKPDKRYKYIFSLVEQQPDGQLKTLAAVEREPYEGDIPTLYWDPGKTIMEYTEFPPAAGGAPTPAGPRFYALQMYDAETLAKLPVTKLAGGALAPDGVTALFPIERP